MKNIGRVALLGLVATVGSLAVACGPSRETDAGDSGSGNDARSDARNDATETGADVPDVALNDAADVQDVAMAMDVADAPAPIDVQDVAMPMDIVDVPAPRDVVDVPITSDTGPVVDGGMGPRFMVVRLGDGAGPLAATGARVFLDEYTLSGTRTRGIALPGAMSGSNYPFVISGTANSEGALSRSNDGHYVTLAGYAAAPATAGVSSSSSASTPRVVARVDSAGNVDTSTTLNNAFDTNNVRTATSVDGTAFWVGGSGNTTTSAGGTHYVTLGGTMGTPIETTPTSTRFLQVYSGQLYGSSGTGSFQSVFTIGTGTPIASGQTATVLPGLATTFQAYGFAFVPAAVSGFTDDTLYIADDRATGGGIHKYTYNSTTMTWTAGLDATGLSSGVRGLTAIVSTAGTVTVIGTTAESSANTVVTCADTALATAPVCTVLVTAGTNQIFRGVALSPM
jgi:hypothetical protein